MRNEIDVKSAMMAIIKKEGGYGRRFEDQYAVGLPDTIMIPVGGPVFFAEVKIIRNGKFSPSPRQHVELTRISKTLCSYAVPLVIGCDLYSKRLFLSKSTLSNCVDSATVISCGSWGISELLQLYHDTTKEG